MKTKSINIDISIEQQKPKKCSICFTEESITNVVRGRKTDAWFCTKCGGLVGWIK